jgi:hypothetical protein
MGARFDASEAATARESLLAEGSRGIGAGGAACRDEGCSERNEKHQS